MKKPNIRHAEPRNDGSYGVPPKGWRRETHGKSELEIRNGYVAVACHGEAHSNAHIDGCSVCLQHAWGWRAVRP